MNINILRFLLRFEDNIKEILPFQEFKAIVSPWKNVKTFLGSEIFNHNQFDRSIVTIFLEKIIQLNDTYSLNLSKMPSTDIEVLTKDELNTYENLLYRSKFVYLKRMSLRENQISKVLFVLIQIIQEIQNLSWLVFGKSQGFDNEVISERLFII